MKRHLILRILAASFVVAVSVSPLSAQDIFGGLGPKARHSAAKPGAKKSNNGPKANKPDMPNKVDQQGRKQGLWAEKYDNGYYKYKGSFVDGKPQDITRYDESGHVSVVMKWDAADSCHVQTFSDNGRVESKGVYFNQKKEGTWTFFTYEGLLLGTTQYVKGIKHGSEVLFHENGKIAEKTIWVDGLRNGDFRSYFPGGATKIAASYKDGQLHGHYKVWASDGKVCEEGDYDSGVKVGDWSLRFTDGSGLSVVMKYDKHGLLTNKDEVDAIETKRNELMEQKRGTIVDPADYVLDENGRIINAN